MRHTLRALSLAQPNRVAPMSEDTPRPDRGERGAAAFGQRLIPAALHEFYAASEAEAVSASGCAVLAARSLAEDGRFLWIRHSDLDREAGALYPPGLVDLGIDPAALCLVRGRHVKAVLQAGLEAARCAAARMILLEFRGGMDVYDLTASRRLMSAARVSGARIFLLRSAVPPAPSAADTRWLIGAARSIPLAAHAPGAPAFALTLLRDRRGREGHRWTLEWNRERGCFDERPAIRVATAATPPPISGGVVSFPAHRQVPSSGPRRWSAG